MSDHGKTLAAEKRELVGKKVKRLRREGWLPAVMYGRRDPINIQLNTLQTYLALRDADDNALFDLQLEGESYKVFIRDTQRHVTRGDLLHVDFLEVDMDHAITAEVAIVLVGKHTVSTEIPGNISQLLYQIEVEAKPQDLISEIELDVSQIADPNDVLMVSDLVAPEGISILTEGEIAVAKFDIERIQEEEEDDGEDGMLSLLDNDEDDDE